MDSINANYFIIQNFLAAESKMVGSAGSAQFFKRLSILFLELGTTKGTKAYKNEAMERKIRKVAIGFILDNYVVKKWFFGLT